MYMTLICCIILTLLYLEKDNYIDLFQKKIEIVYGNMSGNKTASEYKL